MGESSAKSLVNNKTTNICGEVLEVKAVAQPGKQELGLVAGCVTPWGGCAVHDGVWGRSCGELIAPWQPLQQQEKGAVVDRKMNKQRGLDSLSEH